MSVNVQQFKHNECFHTSVCQSFPDDYYDWKIICVFYCALHLLHAFAEKKGKSLGRSHHDTLTSINPNHKECKLQIKNDVYEAYHALYRYGMDARYDGFEDLELFTEMKKADYVDAIRRFNYIKGYAIKNGLKL